MNERTLLHGMVGCLVDGFVVVVVAAVLFHG
jgi:hypothetical protein